MIPTLILAAGRSSRMGDRDKLLEDVDGAPLLRVLSERALSVGPVYVTVPSPTHRRRYIIPQDAQIVPITGEMSDSIRAGLAALPDVAAGVIILPGDMPDITADDLSAIKAKAETSNAAIVRATTQDGKPGHPIYFARETFADFDTLEGDRGAFRICANWTDQTEYVPLNGQRARLDLDTPADWEAYRAKATE